MWIYSLNDPNTDVIKYVGQTVKKRISDRYSHHMHCASRGMKTHLYNWVRSLMKEGKKPVIKILHSANNLNDLNILERYYIHKFRRQGIILCNQTDGGDGTPGFSRKGQKGHQCSEETKRKLSAINMGKRYDDEYKRKMSEACKKKRATEETKKKMSASNGKKRPIIVDGFIYDSLALAIRVLKISKTTLDTHLANKVKNPKFKAEYLI